MSAPGKVILMGEHAAVYGGAAVVAAVDLRLSVEAGVGPAAGSGARGEVRLALPDIGVEETHRWSRIVEYADQARRRWRAFERGEQPFAANHDPGALVRVAVGEALASLPAAATSGLTGRDLVLRLQSEIPVGAGLGSSAAAAVGVVAAVRALATGAPGPGSPRRRWPDPGELAAIETAALEVERRQHGLPSGIDSGTVLRGGVLFVRREGPGPGDGALDDASVGAGLPGHRADRRKSRAAAFADATVSAGLPDPRKPRAGAFEARAKRSRSTLPAPPSPKRGGVLRFDHLPQPDWLSEAIRIFDSGRPDETTGAVVAAVRRRRDREPERIGASFDRIEAAVLSFRAALRDGGRRDAAAAVARGHCALVELGVVPEAVALRIESVEAAGGAAKISGAGALGGESAGALLCMLGDLEPEAIDGLLGLDRVNARIGAGGLRFEDDAPETR